ncbi:ninjurin-2 [Orussus abietinus]|uniref:ninjurin-2 n=1 Tax=Orussus abietinus TaxID=222816 RepID=UPI0006261C37|nr:ninjurin-2 [Orussus abietinus]
MAAAEIAMADAGKNATSENETPNKSELPEVMVVQETKKKEIVVTVDTTDKRTRRSPGMADTYAAKKTVAQGMMDVALITANANQLRYLIEYQSMSPTFYMNVALISISLLLQIAVGVSLIFKGRFDMRGESHSLNARRINNYVVVGVFLVTIINVFVAAFSINVGVPYPPPTEKVVTDRL